MTDKTLQERVSAAIAKSGLAEISPEKRLKLEEFAGEVALWSARMHLVGRGSIRKNLGLLILDSLLLLKNAEDSGLIPGEDARTSKCGGGEESPGADRPSANPECPMAERSDDRLKASGIPFALKVADIGSGAGFPGIVWKIARPDLEVTLFERKERTHAFLERIITTLGMPGLEAVSEDAERYSRARPFDIVTSKAAGRLSGLLPLAERLLISGGVYLTIKGETWQKELSGATPPTMRFLGANELPERRGVAVGFRKMPPE